MSRDYTHLIRTPVEEAVVVIHETAGPKFDIHEIEEGTITTMEFIPNRIRVWYDPETNLVTSVTEG